MDSRHMSGVTLRKSPLGAGGLMVIAKMSGSGQACSSLARSSAFDESATIGLTLTLYFAEIALAAFFNLSLRLSGNHQVHTCLCQSFSRCPSHPGAPACHYGFLALYLKIHSGSSLVNYVSRSQG